MYDENDIYKNENEEVTENENVAEETKSEEVYDGMYSESEKNDTNYDFSPLETKTKKDSKVGRIIAVTLLVSLIAGVGFSVANFTTSRLLRKNIKIDTTQSVLSKSDGKTTASGTVSEIVEACMPSIVSITNKGVTEISTFFGNYLQESTGSGSGIIIGQNEEELLIVSNYHVVADSNELSVVFSNSGTETSKDGKNPSAISAKVKGYDEDKDLAVIAVKLDDIPNDVLSTMKVATIGDSTALKAGDQVVAIGNALGYGQSVTTGIISALNREVTMQGTSGNEVSNKFIQTDAAINPGNSGGALLNMNGELIGINSVKIASSGVEGMGYAIPITDVEAIINNLMVMQTRDVVDEEKQGFLGITGQDVTSNVSQAYGLPVGVFVKDVEKDSGAEKGGLKSGNIITKLDGVSVKSMSELKNRLTYYEAGETVKLTIMVQENNEYKEKELSVTLGEKPQSVKEQDKKQSNIQEQFVK